MPCATHMWFDAEKPCPWCPQPRDVYPPATWIEEVATKEAMELRGRLEEAYADVRLTRESLEAEQRERKDAHRICKEAVARALEYAARIAELEAENDRLRRLLRREDEPVSDRGRFRWSPML